MPDTPRQELVRDRGWQAGLAAVLAAVAFAFHGVLADLGALWVSKADYSHGPFVVLFAGYLLWTRRRMFPEKVHWPDAWGLPFFAAGAAIYLVEERVNFGKEWAQAFAADLCLAGAVVMFCGRWKGLLWAWPALLFLPLAFKIPDRLEHDLILKLRTVATEGANFVFQTLGLASYTEGNVIVIGDTSLGVEKACSGLSMLLVFVALAAGLALVYESRPKIDRLVVFLSAVPIAVVCNLVRIVVTGFVYKAGWRELGDLLFHDLFGWAMMPLALGLIWLELKLIDWVTEPVDRLGTDEALGLPGRRRGGPVVPGVNR